MRLSRDDLRGKGQTVLGLVDPADFGPTLLHEHIICDARPPSERDDDRGRHIKLCERWQTDYGEVKAPGNWHLDEHFGTENSYYEFDLTVDMPNDEVKLRYIPSLLDHGHAGRVAISASG